MASPRLADQDFRIQTLEHDMAFYAALANAYDRMSERTARRALARSDERLAFKAVHLVAKANGLRDKVSGARSKLANAKAERGY